MFSHARHSGTVCKRCHHEMSSPDTIVACRQCHTKQSTGKMSSVAIFHKDCIGCHAQLCQSCIHAASYQHSQCRRALPHGEAGDRKTRSQGYGRSPFKVVRELGLDRRETVRSLSAVGVRNLREAAPGTRGPSFPSFWCSGCHTGDVSRALTQIE